MGAACSQSGKMAETLEQMYEVLQKDEKCSSLLKAGLTKESVEKYKDTKTSLGAKLTDCIKSGEYFVTKLGSFVTRSTRPPVRAAAVKLAGRLLVCVESLSNVCFSFVSSLY